MLVSLSYHLIRTGPYIADPEVARAFLPVRISHRQALRQLSNPLRQCSGKNTGGAYCAKDREPIAVHCVESFFLDIGVTGARGRFHVVRQCPQQASGGIYSGGDAVIG